MTREERPTKGEQTREMIIRQSAAVFNQFGFFGTSISDIMRETGLEKGGIYNHFPEGKEQLALAAFDYSRDHTSRKLEEAFKQVRHAADRLVMFARILESRFDDPELPGGCVILNTAVEADDAHPVLREKARQAMDDLYAMVLRVLTKGIERGEIKAEVDREAAATILISTVEGAMMLSKLYGDVRYLSTARQHVEQYVERELRA
ncbi:MAG: TetR/AcrR family transcriptional regulator [Anaerolineae bacterium]|nr:TetR/AcrR family transcriptional regulator [Anaerolineae bacterium]